MSFCKFTKLKKFPQQFVIQRLLQPIIKTIRIKKNCVSF